MNKRNWKILYTSYRGMGKKALELVYREMGALILRDAGIYRIHVLACEEAKVHPVGTNAVLLGLYDENPLVRDYVEREEIPEDGYVVRVTENREDPEKKIAVITAFTEQALFYGAVDFVDDYFAAAPPTDHGAITLVDEIFDFSLPNYYSAVSPDFKTRSVFTWGHPLTDYRTFIENMARLRLNELIIWNDYVPLNAADVVAYAHEWGISVIWGFAWGWTRECASTDLTALDKLASDVLTTYEKNYADLPGDGIYFQSFTEFSADRIGDRLVAEAVTDFVNTVSGRILEKHANLRIQFGLHASSVRDHLSYIAATDPRVEILWEDCGIFPYSYDPYEKDEKEFDRTVAFTDEILALRSAGESGVLFKGFATLDWCGDRFVHQVGPFVLGVSSSRLIKHDREMLTPIWRPLQTGWMQNGEAAYRMAAHIRRHGSRVRVGMAGQFSGGVWFAEALCAEIFFNGTRPYEDIFCRVSRRRCVEIV